MPAVSAKVALCAMNAPGRLAPSSAQMAIRVEPPSASAIVRNSCSVASLSSVTGITNQVSGGGLNSFQPDAEACPTVYGVLAAQAPHAQICRGAVHMAIFVHDVPQLLT